MEASSQRFWFRNTERAQREIEFFIDNLLVRIHFITVMIRWTGLSVLMLMKLASFDESSLKF